MRWRLRQRHGPFFAAEVLNQMKAFRFRNGFQEGRWIQKNGRWFRQLGEWVAGLMRS